jgi:hypothetical protein
MRSESNKRPIPPWSILHRHVSLVRSPARLLITSRGIHQRSGPSHHTTQSQKPPILPAFYIHSGRISSSALHTETRLGKRARLACRASGIQLSPAPQSTQTVPPVTFEYVPAQHRHASVDRHEVVRVAVLHQLPSVARRHARMIHLTFSIDKSSEIAQL